MRPHELLCVVASLSLVTASISAAFSRELTVPKGTCPTAESLKELGLDDAELQSVLKTAGANPKYAKLKELMAKIETCQAIQLQEQAKANEAKALAAAKQTETPRAANDKAAQTSKPTDDSKQFRFLLRQDFTDVSIITVPDPSGSGNSKASGASIGYTKDGVTKNALWTVQGTVIGAYSFDNGYGPENTVNLYAGTFGLYAGLNKQANSNPKIAATKDSDVQSYGGLIELGFDHILGGDQWIRAKSGVVEDHIRSTTTWSTTLEWIPVYPPFIHFPRFISLPLTQVGFRFDPSIVVQYDTARNQKLLFSNGPDSLRIGPQLSLWVQPFADIAYLSNINWNTTYHRYYETYSGRYLYWFQTAATYNLDASGMLGLTGSYQRGNDELTGKKTDQLKLTLTGKLDYCTAWCPPPKR